MARMLWAWCFAALVTIASTESMICNKPSIRQALSKDTEDLGSDTWANIAQTAKQAAADMARNVELVRAALVQLEADTEARRKEEAYTDLTAADTESLVDSACKASGSFGSAAIAKDWGCGMGDGTPEDKFDDIEDMVDATNAAFKAAAKELFNKGGKRVKRADFKKACNTLISDDDMSGCVDLCQDWSSVVGSLSTKSAGAHNLGGKTYDELVAETKAKRDELATAEKDQKECQDSIETVAGLAAQFTKLSDALEIQETSCRSTKRSLRTEQRNLRKATKEFEAAKQKDEEARQKLAAALAEEKEAQDNLDRWQEHMARLKEAIAKQLELVAQTEAALRRAQAAAQAVADFKNKLSFALVGLVTYYDEAVRQPMRNIGLREEVDIGAVFPTPSETLAAENLRESLAATKTFCGEKKEDFAKVPSVEADGVKLPAICESQDWDTVAGEIDSVVKTKRERTVRDLNKVQKKVKSYKGVVADKTLGEVEGVWKAMALFGGTKFSQNYLSGWRFSKNGQERGDTAGFMIELARALKAAAEAAMKKWEEAKKQLKVLEDEKEQVVLILQQAVEWLEEAVAARKVAEKEAADAAEALRIAKAEKERVEQIVADLTQRYKELSKSVEQAKDALDATHKEAMGSFMELLHVAEQGEQSWD